MVMLEELREFGVANLPGIWLDTGDAVQGCILLVESNLDFEDFSEAIQNSIFIRHLASVDYEDSLKGTESDIEYICAFADVLGRRMEPGRSFSVQTRILGTGKLPYRKVVINELLSQFLIVRSDSEMDCRNPEQVVSVLCTPKTTYIGLSETSLNRSSWPGGKHRFKREDDQISRAEFKMLEALSVFGLSLPSNGLALDIGASPGGWTRMLAEAGLTVDAVDPAELDPKLRGNRRVRHLRKRIQEYQAGSKKFRAIVNDMKMDARDSIEIMLRFASRLEPDGLGLMTLKLPQAGRSPREARATLGMVWDDLNRLSEGYEIVGARQLYHNRSEVTVALRARG